MGLAEYQEKFTRLVVNHIDGRPSPHKLCMVLAVLDLARSGSLTQNEIRYAPPLLERYLRLFQAVRGSRDHPNAYFPFFHLSGSLRGGATSFWHLKAQQGRETVLATIRTVRSGRDITDNIAYATLDPALFLLLQNEDSIEALAHTVAQYWLQRGFDELLKVAEYTRLSSVYERKLREGVLGATEPRPPGYVRDPAFRRLVTEIYDYRCAATGLRVLLSTGEAMVG
jgi:putative restriction endonuclease